MASTEVASFTDRYGDERVIHKTRNGLTVKQQAQTPVLRLNQEITLLLGQNISKLRKEHGWSLAELAIRSGLRTVSPKQRMWEIENSSRKEGVRLGTLYAIAMALGVEVTDLLPSVKQVAKAAEIHAVAIPELQVGG